MLWDEQQEQKVILSGCALCLWCLLLLSFTSPFVSTDDRCHIITHPDGQHDMSVTLQDFNCVAVCDVTKTDAVGRQDLIAHFDPMLLRQSTRVQPETDMDKHTQTTTTEKALIAQHNKWHDGNFGLIY